MDCPDSADCPMDSIDPMLVEIALVDSSSLPNKTKKLRIGPGNPLRIGRDPKTNDVVLAHPAVSRNHLEFYVILYDQDGGSRPMIYARDRQSANGTFVNGVSVGRAPLITPGRLLDGGDVVTVEPYWSFTLLQDKESYPNIPLGLVQRQEAQAIDRFQITDRSLGQGAHATAYLAFDKQSGRQLVCKVYAFDDLDDYFSKKAMQEVHILSQLDHPNIISFKQAFFTRSSLFIFIELATGGDLFSYLCTREALPEHEVRWVMRQITSGVAYLHGKGIVHRDIKLENILCATCPSSIQRLVLCDFSLSAVQSRGRMASCVGTPKLQAPEMLVGDGYHDSGVDVWAIGLLALKLLIGDDNLEKGSATSVAVQTWFATVPSKGPGSISTDGQDFLKRCLVSNPRDRVSARQALLHPWLRDLPQQKGMFRKLEEEIRSSWRPREIILPVVTRLAPTHEPKNEERPEVRSTFFPGSEITPAPSRDLGMRPEFC